MDNPWQGNRFHKGWPSWFNCPPMPAPLPAAPLTVKGGPTQRRSRAPRGLQAATSGRLPAQRRLAASARPIDERTPMRRTASTLSIVIGSLLIIGGVATWIVVSNTLADQKITVSDDASCLAGDEVNGPFSAYCEAMVIDKHALEATGGLRYAELDRQDPKRETAMTASFLQASLFTSVVAFGVAAMAIAVGVLFILIGLGMRDVARQIREVATRTPATT
jgi:hypothetical protein